MTSKPSPEFDEETLPPAMRAGVGRSPEPQQLRRRFGVVLVFAFLVLAGQGIAAFIVSAGCVNANEVGCHGPTAGVPTAPRFWLGTELQIAGASATLLLILIGMAGATGFRPLQKQLIVWALGIILIAAGIASIQGESVLHDSLTSRYCGEIQGCYSD